MRYLKTLIGLALLTGCGGAGDSQAGPLIEENFDSGQIGELWNDSFIRMEYYTNRATPFLDIPGHGKVLHYYVPAGQNEITPVSIGATGADAFQKITGESNVDEFYIEWEEFFPEGRLFPVGAQKLLRFTGYYPDEAQGCQMNVIVNDNNTNVQISFVHPGPNDEVSIDKFTNSHRGVATGQWLKFGVWAKLNTPGKSDGFGYVYINGNEVAGLSNASLRGDDSRGWNTMWIGGTFSNGARRLSSRAGSRYIDNIRWYSTKPR